MLISKKIDQNTRVGFEDKKSKSIFDKIVDNIFPKHDGENRWSEDESIGLHENCGFYTLLDRDGYPSDQKLRETEAEQILSSWGPNIRQDIWDYYQV